MMPIDPAQQARELAQIFFNLSNAVDDFRLRNFSSLSPAQQQQLKDQAQALDTRAQQFVAAALAAILQAVQPHLAGIKQATKDAQDALAHLDDIAKGMAIVDAAVALVGSIASGDVGSIGGGLQNLVATLSPVKKP